MKRIRIMGLCLVAAFALTAVIASGAQAGQYGVCGKAAKVGKSYTGKYIGQAVRNAGTER